MEYKCVRGPAETEIIEKRSKFIAAVSPVSSEEEAAEFLRTVREKHRDATHNPFAYLLYKNGIVRFSDDGEPQGTSGKPILDVLKGRGLYDSAIVVTRYFGGILLGAGGLVRVYSAAAAQAAEAAGVYVKKSGSLYQVVADYRFYEPLRLLTERFGGRVAETDFGEKVTVSVLVPDGEAQNFLREIKDRTGGNAALTFIKTMVE